jgi:hypothetical protein
MEWQVLRGDIEAFFFWFYHLLDFFLGWTRNLHHPVLNSLWQCGSVLTTMFL